MKVTVYLSELEDVHLDRNIYEFHYEILPSTPSSTTRTIDSNLNDQESLLAFACGQFDPMNRRTPPLKMIRPRHNVKHLVKQRVSAAVEKIYQMTMDNAEGQTSKPVNNTVVTQQFSRRCTEAADSAVHRSTLDSAVHHHHCMNCVVF